MCSNTFESTLQKLVQVMGACRLILLTRSSGARSGESSIPASSTVPFDLRRHSFNFSADSKIKTVLSIGDLSLEPSSEQQLTLVQDVSACRGQLPNRLVFGSPLGFFASASTILISSTQSSGFLSKEPPITDMFTQLASLKDSLVLAVGYLWFSWRSTCFASLHDRVRAGRSEPLSFSLAVTCTCPRSCGSTSSARIAPPCFKRLRFQLRLSSRDSKDFCQTSSTDMTYQCWVAWMVRTWRFKGFVAESEESRPT